MCFIAWIGRNLSFCSSCWCRIELLEEKFLSVPILHRFYSRFQAVPLDRTAYADPDGRPWAPDCACCADSPRRLGNGRVGGLWSVQENDVLDWCAARLDSSNDSERFRNQPRGASFRQCSITTRWVNVDEKRAGEKERFGSYRIHFCFSSLLFPAFSPCRCLASCKIIVILVLVDAAVSLCSKALSFIIAMTTTSLMSSPPGIAIDWISKNMYWTDTGVDRIFVSRLDGSHRRSIINESLQNPRAIEVDPVRG